MRQIMGKEGKEELEEMKEKQQEDDGERYGK
jgi:hypothetical protein